MRKLFESATEQELRMLNIDPGKAPDERFLQFLGGSINLATSSYVLAMVAAESLGRKSDAALENEIYDSYNGMAAPYMRTLAVGLPNRMRKGELAGHNDAYDQDHFAYLEAGVTLITDDRKMCDLARSVGVMVATSAAFAEFVARATP